MSYTIPFQLGSSCKCGSDIQRNSRNYRPINNCKTPPGRRIQKIIDSTRNDTESCLKIYSAQTYFFPFCGAEFLQHISLRIHTPYGPPYTCTPQFKSLQTLKKIVVMKKASQLTVDYTSLQTITRTQ
jgi:hypothetical protein